MLLMTKEIAAALPPLYATDGKPEAPVIVKYFTPDASGTWHVIEGEYDEDEKDWRLFGLCDLGHGTPELGYISLNELSTVRGGLRLPVERDLYFNGYVLDKHALQVRKATAPGVLSTASRITEASAEDKAAMDEFEMERRHAEDNQPPHKAAPIPQPPKPKRPLTWEERFVTEYHLATGRVPSDSKVEEAKATRDPNAEPEETARNLLGIQ